MGAWRSWYIPAPWYTEIAILFATLSAVHTIRSPCRSGAHQNSFSSFHHTSVHQEASVVIPVHFSLRNEAVAECIDFVVKFTCLYNPIFEPSLNYRTFKETKTSFFLFQVLQEDDLSQKICHACISYLNSWQSFKNRCDAAEKRQRSWTEIDRVAISSAVDRNAVIQHVKELCPGVTIESISQKVPPRLTDTADKSRTSHGTLQEQLKENGVQISSSSASGNLVNMFAHKRRGVII